MNNLIDGWTRNKEDLTPGIYIACRGKVATFMNTIYIELSYDGNGNLVDHNREHINSYNDSYKFAGVEYP